MSKDNHIKPVSRMNVYELLDFILWFPEYLSDPYYREFAKEINIRFEQLKKERHE